MRKFVFLLTLLLLCGTMLHAASTERRARVAIVWLSYDEAMKMSEFNKNFDFDLRMETIWTLMQMRVPSVHKEVWRLTNQGYHYTGSTIDELDYQYGDGRFGWIYEKRDTN